MEKNQIRLKHAINALLSIETDDKDMASNIIDVIKQLDCMVDNRVRIIRPVREWMNG